MIHHRTCTPTAARSIRPQDPHCVRTAFARVFRTRQKVAFGGLRASTHDVLRLPESSLLRQVMLRKPTTEHSEGSIFDDLIRHCYNVIIRTQIRLFWIRLFMVAGRGAWLAHPSPLLSFTRESPPNRNSPHALRTSTRTVWPRRHPPSEKASWWDHARSGADYKRNKTRNPVVDRSSIGITSGLPHLFYHWQP